MKGYIKFALLKIHIQFVHIPAKDNTAKLNN